MADLTYRGDAHALLGRLSLLPAALAGLVPGHERAAAAVSRALGIEALSCVREAFVAKSRGQAGSDGITWAPLSAKTIAYGRRHPGLNAKRTRAKKGGRGSRPLLTAAQDRQWRAVYASAVRSGKDGAAAAAIAWGVVKRAGGKTILGQYGKAQVQINVDTGRLLASLGPGAAGNVLEARPGSVTVGSNVSYAEHVHRRRPLYPPDDSLPPAWEARLQSVLEAAMPGFIRSFLGQ